MKSLTRNRAITASLLGCVILLFTASAGAQEKGSNRDDSGPFKVRIPFRFNPAGDGMTAIDPPLSEIPQPKRSLIGIESTSNGTIQRFSDGSNIELRPECQTETLCDGTKIETLPTGTTIVRWPNGSGVVRNPDGSGAEFRPDPRDLFKSGDLVATPGTIEVLPGGVVRQTLKDDGVVLDRFPDGTIKSRPDLVKPEAKTSAAKLGTVELRSVPLNLFKESVNVEKKNPGRSTTLMPTVKPTIIK